jgi:hypothetical protein
VRDRTTGATISLLDLGSDLDLHLDLPPRVKELVETKAFGRCVSEVSHGAGRSGRLRATALPFGAAASYTATGPRGLPGPGGTTPRPQGGQPMAERLIWPIADVLFGEMKLVVPDDPEGLVGSSR